MEFQFGEVNIVCTQLERSLDFYQRHLGFKEHSREDGCVHLKCGPQQFLLLPSAEKATGNEGYGTTATISFDLYTEDAAQAYLYFQKHGISFAKHPEKTGDYFFIEDPDGNIIEIAPNT